MFLFFLKEMFGTYVHKSENERLKDFMAVETMNRWKLKSFPATVSRVRVYKSHGMWNISVSRIAQNDSISVGDFSSSLQRGGNEIPQADIRRCQGSRALLLLGPQNFIECPRTRKIYIVICVCVCVYVCKPGEKKDKEINAGIGSWLARIEFCRSGR